MTRNQLARTILGQLDVIEIGELIAKLDDVEVKIAWAKTLSRLAHVRHEPEPGR